MTKNLWLLAILALPILGCGQASVQTQGAADRSPGDAPLFISVVSDLDSNPQVVDMALKLAGFALQEGREVFLFFNVKGIHVVLNTLSPDASFGDGPPIQEQLSSLIQGGATVHACPVCMKALAVEAGDLTGGVKVTDRAALFSRISPVACVFTY